MRLLKILRQDLENILRNPVLIFSNTILPLILIGVMGFVTKGGFGTELVSLLQDERRRFNRSIYYTNSI